jgi:hypothetical protein
VLCGLLALGGGIFVFALVVGRRGDVGVVLLSGRHGGCCFGDRSEDGSCLVRGRHKDSIEAVRECALEYLVENEAEEEFRRVPSESFTKTFGELEKGVELQLTDGWAMSSVSSGKGGECSMSKSVLVGEGLNWKCPESVLVGCGLDWKCRRK